MTSEATIRGMPTVVFFFLKVESHLPFQDSRVWRKYLSDTLANRHIEISLAAAFFSLAFTRSVLPTVRVRQTVASDVILPPFRN